jgi:putative CocE/NonD family hydrolase
MPARTDTEHRYETVISTDVRIPTGTDGLTLSGRLIRPDTAGPVPALVTALPYRHDVAALTGFPTERWLAARGYACLVVDMIGTGSSDGVQRPPFDAAESDDALDAIDWAARQPWCTGSVGMWGTSYGAMTTLRAAARRPAALRAIIVIQGTPDPGRDFVHPGGSRGAFSPLASWSLSTLFNQLLPPVGDYADPAEQTRWRRRLAAAPYLLDLFRNGPGAAVWSQRRIDAAAIDVPTLCVAGWRDLFSDGTVEAYEQILAPKRLIAGPWLHVQPHECPFTPIDFLPIARSWWDRWLLNEPPDADDGHPVSVYVQGHAPRWLGASSWPPSGRTRSEDLGRWLRTAPETPDPVVGLQSGLWSTPSGLFGLPLDQHGDDSRSLCYTSEPLDAPLLISGRPLVEVSCPWPRVSVKLTDVDPAGRSLLICAGLAGTADGADPLAVGLTPTTYEVAAGHRIRVVLAPGDFPRVWPRNAPEGDWPSAKTLRLPVVTEPLSPVEFATPELPGPVEETDDQTASWEITEDLVHDTVSLRLAGHNRIEPGDGVPVAHTVDVSQELTAVGYRLEPEESTVGGRIVGTVDTATGAHVTVDVAITATATSLDATGKVVLDGVLLLDRRWRG